MRRDGGDRASGGALGQSEREARTKPCSPSSLQTGAPLGRNRAGAAKIAANASTVSWRQSGADGANALKDRRPGSLGSLPCRLNSCQRRPGSVCSPARWGAAGDSPRPTASCGTKGGCRRRSMRPTRATPAKSRACPRPSGRIFPADFLAADAAPTRRQKGHRVCTVRNAPAIGQPCLRACRRSRTTARCPCTSGSRRRTDASSSCAASSCLGSTPARPTSIASSSCPAESFGSLDIVRSVVRLHDEFGLPPELYFERGTWQRSLVISGRGDEVPWKQRVYGLRDLGVRLSHALDPSAKVVERVLGALQNRMERERGYCGRDERRDCPEAVAKGKRAVEAGRCHPGECFYSYADWVARLNVLCDAYNDEPQGGKMLAGLSPRQAFVQAASRAANPSGRHHPLLAGQPPARGKGDGTRPDGPHRQGVLYLQERSHRSADRPARARLVRRGRSLADHADHPRSERPGDRPTGNGVARLARVYGRHRAGQTGKRRALGTNPTASTARCAKSTRRNWAEASLAPFLADREHPPTGRRDGPAEDDDEGSSHAKTQRTRAAVHESAARVGLRLPPTDDPRRLEAQSKLVALLGPPGTDRFI